MSSETFPAYVVRSQEQGSVTGEVELLCDEDLPPGELLLEVEYSSLNYKDALACQGHPGVVKSLPHVPGIDCAGRILKSNSPEWNPGTPVLVTGYELGAPHWGGFSRRVSVPADWPVSLPEGLDTREAMIYGTAGFTAAQCVDALARHHITPERGPVVVTGATGGVGCLAVAILAKIGYKVTAVTGKPQLSEALYLLGATDVVGRETLLDDPKRPLLSASWAGAVDTVGGSLLTAILKSTMHRGCVTACGLVAGDQLPMTVYPFILRGVTLAGIDSAKCPRADRLRMWQLLAGAWRVELPDPLFHTITLQDLPDQVQRMLDGGAAGRTIIRLT